MVSRPPLILLATLAAAGLSATPAAAQCAFTLSSPGSFLGKSGGGGTAAFTASNGGCSWTALSDSAWLQITSSTAGIGSGSVTFAVTSDPGAGRLGHITIAGQSFPVTQTQDDPTFVGQAYQDMLFRPADPGGASYWTGQLSAGVSRAQMAATLATSGESLNYGLWVIRAYWSVFRRDPDVAGWQYWMGLLQQGVTKSAIMAFFVTSPEFQNTYGSLSNSAFVNLVYQNVLGRAPDTAGFNFWLGELNANQITRGDMMNGFVDSPEFITNQRARSEADLLYVGLLRQTPDPVGVVAAAAQLAPGDSALPGVIASFLANPLYVARF